jgi:hypothetical protein
MLPLSIYLPTVLIPSLADSIGPMVDPQVESFLTQISYNQTWNNVLWNCEV